MADLLADGLSADSIVASTLVPRYETVDAMRLLDSFGSVRDD